MLREKRGGSDDRLQFIPNCQRRINDIGSECHVFMFKPTLYSTATMGSDSSNKEDDDHVTWKVCKPNKVQDSKSRSRLHHFLIPNIARHLHFTFSTDSHSLS